MNRRRSQILKIGWITVGWTAISVFQFFSHYSLLEQFQCPTPGMDHWIHFCSHFFTGILAGLAGSGLTIFLWERWLRTQAYGWALVRMVLSYTLIYLSISIPAGVYFQLTTTERSLVDLEVWRAVLLHHASPIQWSSYLNWLLIVLATMIILLVNDKYGPGAFRDFLLGKYFHPKREERIFMFLDLRSSTAIAEKLGDEQYFNFISDVFRIATPPIVYSKGEIYQYVGDEIIVSWKPAAGAKNASCLNCFFEIQTALQQKAPYFDTHYGLQPEFKAGLHFGPVIAGEIGVVKRDIAFSGDVLNTTARIQAMCNDLGVNILFSSLLLDRLQLPSGTFAPKRIGNMELRGKQEAVLLFTV
ncbi:MAG: adenylate/guanylate cyclase domain-containing protein [Saprospiraceae bacterium]|nr:adenylate/guanylate cyclase domain-containing protein [Saprospiraceae bacterium]